MSYQIAYGNSNLIKRPVGKKKLKTGYLIPAVAGLLIVGLLQIEPVRDFLIPGDAEATKEAFYTLTQELEAGSAFSDAAAAFCRQLIERDTVA